MSSTPTPHRHQVVLQKTQATNQPAGVLITAFADRQDAAAIDR
jgi:hypothetical protein